MRLGRRSADGGPQRRRVADLPALARRGRSTSWRRSRVRGPATSAVRSPRWTSWSRSTSGCSASIRRARTGRSATGSSCRRAIRASACTRCSRCAATSRRRSSRRSTARFAPPEAPGLRRLPGLDASTGCSARASRSRSGSTGAAVSATRRTCSDARRRREAGGGRSGRRSPWRGVRGRQPDRDHRPERDAAAPAGPARPGSSTGATGAIPLATGRPGGSRGLRLAGLSRSTATTSTRSLRPAPTRGAGGARDATDRSSRGPSRAAASGSPRGSASGTAEWRRPLRPPRRSPRARRTRDEPARIARSGPTAHRARRDDPGPRPRRRPRHSTRADRFGQAYPDRFIEMGIAEQGMVGTRIGLSPRWASSHGSPRSGSSSPTAPSTRSAFPSRSPRRTSRSPPPTSGVQTGFTGKTHVDIEDLTIMRAMPGMTVLVPGDATECAAMTRWATATTGPVYLRLGREGGPGPRRAGLRLRAGAGDPAPRGHGGPAGPPGQQTGAHARGGRAPRGDGISAGVLHVPCAQAAWTRPRSRPPRAASPSSSRSRSTPIIGGLGGLVAEIVTAGDAAPGHPDRDRGHLGRIGPERLVLLERTA